MSRKVAVPVLMGSISAARAKEGRFFIEPDLLKQVEVYRGAIGGVIALPQHLYPAILKIQDTNLSCVPAISQHAAVGALEIGPACGGAGGRWAWRLGIRAREGLIR